MTRLPLSPKRSTVARRLKILRLPVRVCSGNTVLCTASPERRQILETPRSCALTPLTLSHSIRSPKSRDPRSQVFLPAPRSASPSLPTTAVAAARWASAGDGVRSCPLTSLVCANSECTAASTQSPNEPSWRRQASAPPLPLLPPGRSGACDGAELMR